METDDGTRHDIQKKKLDTAKYLGYCFRPLAIWKNSLGQYEMSKENVMIGEDALELILSGCYSGEEILKITFPLKDIEKVDAYFFSKSVLLLYVREDLYEAASQCLAMACIASFSFIDQDEKRIRVILEQLDDKGKTLLVEYFRRNAIYFKVSSKPLEEQIFFKPVQKPALQKYDSYDPSELEDYVNTIKTFKYLDRDTFCCKVCDYYSEKRDTVIRHVNEFHIKPKKRMSDHDSVINYIETNHSEEEE